MSAVSTAMSLPLSRCAVADAFKSQQFVEQYFLRLAVLIGQQQQQQRTSSQALAITST